MGIDHLLRMKINIDWNKEGYEGVVESTIKKYNSMIHTQSAVYCMVELVSRTKSTAKVVSIEADVFQLAYDFAGGGLWHGQSHPDQRTSGSQPAVSACGVPP